MTTRLAFCTLGMLIIDEIDYGQGEAKQYNVIGGAGTYATLGARLAAGRDNAHLVSWIVDKGSDFPEELTSLIGSWQTNCVFRTNLNRLTTRAWNGYGPNQNRAFKYITPKQRLEVHDLNNAQSMASSSHMVCSPARCIDLVSGINGRRRKLDATGTTPIYVWEPVPDMCTPEEFVNLQKAVQGVSLISPNREELSRFFEDQSLKSDRSAMVEATLRLMPDSGLPVIVREGADGCFLFMNQLQVHFPAYHQQSAPVVDPTGGGNAFLGALAVAMAGHASPTEGSLIEGWVLQGAKRRSVITAVFAIIHATVSASYAIEQVGVPRLKQGRADNWNGDPYMKRFQEYSRREESYIVEQLRQGGIC